MGVVIMILDRIYVIAVSLVQVYMVAGVDSFESYGGWRIAARGIHCCGILEEVTKLQYLASQ